jgi:hypothetical protein
MRGNHRHRHEIPHEQPVLVKLWPWLFESRSVSRCSSTSLYRGIFLDSRHTFYQGLYADGVANARVLPALRLLKQNLAFLVSVIADREMMRASFEAFLMVLTTPWWRTSALKINIAIASPEIRLSTKVC